MIYTLWNLSLPREIAFVIKLQKPIWSNNVKSSLPRWLCFEQRQTFGYCLNHFWYRTSAFQQYHQSWKQLNLKASQLFQKNFFQILSGFWLQRDIMGDLLSYQSVLCKCHLTQTLAPNSTQTFTISPFLFYPYYYFVHTEQSFDPFF